MRIERKPGTKLWSSLTSLPVEADIDATADGADVETGSKRAEWAMIEVIRGDGGAKATLATDPITLNCNTVVRARAGGSGGNSITLSFNDDGTGTGQLVETAYPAIVFHFASGVTTVANFEATLATSTYLEVGTAGTGANVLATTVDEFAATALTGGDTEQDSVITQPLKLWGSADGGTTWYSVSTLTTSNVTVNAARGAAFLVRLAGAYRRLALSAGNATPTNSAAISASYSPVFTQE